MTDTDRLLGWCDNRAVLDPWTRGSLRDIDDVHRHIADLAAEIRRLRARPCPWVETSGSTSHCTLAAAAGPAPTCQTCGDSGLVAATPGYGGDGHEHCPDCGPPTAAGPAPTGDDLSYDAVTANRLLTAYRWHVAALETVLADTGDFITAIEVHHLKPERDALLERIDALEAIDRAPTGDQPS